MPGRQLTKAPSVGKTKPPKQKAKRSLNALSIAEQQNPERIKIRRNRLGQAEKEPSKRKRQSEHEDADPDRGPENLKRRKARDHTRYGNEIEVGSDGSGNEWVAGQVDDDDDSELDSDEAMGESDEELFEGFAFKGGSATTSRRKVHAKVLETDDRDGGNHEIDLRENGDRDDSPDDQSEGLGDDAVDLAAMLDDSEDASEHGGLQPQRLGDSDGSRDGASETDENSHGTDNEFSDEDKTSMLSYSGDEDEPGESAKFAALQALVSTMNKDDQEMMHIRAPADAQEFMTPSEFGTKPKRKFTAADLLNSATEPGVPSSRKVLADDEAGSFSKRASTTKTLEAPLPKRQQDRLDRAAAYEQSKETLKRWIDTVKHNRRAENLSFPLKDAKTATVQGFQRLLPTSHSKPLTELESTVQNVLQESGLATPNGGSGEDKLQAFEELRAYKMPLEEVQRRRAELRKARELLFREEVRAKRIKKIKSKSYRKVHRKERERTAQQEKDALTAAGVDDSEDEQQRKDRRRAEERMGARHRESKWAKGVKDSGRAKWDEDARGGVTEMARRGEELRRRIEGKQVVADEDELLSSESDADDDMDDAEHKVHDPLQRLYEMADNAGTDAQDSRLASMDFMQKAEAGRKARNDADLESLRKDLAGEKTSSDEETSEGPGRRLFGPTKSNSQPSQPPPPRGQKSEFEERQGSNDEDDPERHGTEDVEIITDTPSAKARHIPVAKSSSIARRKIMSLPNSGDHPLDASDNPWLIDSKRNSHGSKRQTKETDRGAIISNTIALANTPPLTMAKPPSTINGTKAVDKTSHHIEPPAAAAPAAINDIDDEEDSDPDPLPFISRNQDLVRKAFAGDEVVADFTHQKRQTAQDEDAQTINATLPGWGTWTGTGISKKQQKRTSRKFPLLLKQPGIAAEKRQDAKLDRVIINEKRVKKNARYLASSLPHPFETKGQYERSLRLPVGPEWTTKETFQAATKPRLLMKRGVIAPMVKPMI